MSETNALAALKQLENEEKKRQIALVLSVVIAIVTLLVPFAFPETGFWIIPSGIGILIVIAISFPEVRNWIIRMLKEVRDWMRNKLNGTQ